MAKKVIAFILMICMLVVVLTGCNSCSSSMKNFKSGFGGLNRVITVRNAFTNEILATYEGNCYISDYSTSGDVTIYFKDTDRKVDWIGNVIVQAEEVLEQ